MIHKHIYNSFFSMDPFLKSLKKEIDLEKRKRNNGEKHYVNRYHDGLLYYTLNALAFDESVLQRLLKSCHEYIEFKTKTNKHPLNTQEEYFKHINKQLKESNNWDEINKVWVKYIDFMNFMAYENIETSCQTIFKVRTFVHVDCLYSKIDEMKHELLELKLPKEIEDKIMNILNDVHNVDTRVELIKEQCLYYIKNYLVYADE